MSRIYCLNCGNEMDTGVRFCPSCGAANTQYQAPVVEADAEDVSEVKAEAASVVNEASASAYDFEPSSEGVDAAAQNLNSFTSEILGGEAEAEEQQSFEEAYEPQQDYSYQYSNIHPEGGTWNAQQNTFEEKEPSKALAIVSMVLGIISLCCCWCFGYSGLLLSAAALVCGIVALVKNMNGKGMAIAGVICGGIALILSVLSGAISNSIVRSGAYGDMLEDYFDLLEDYGIDVDLDDFT